MANLQFRTSSALDRFRDAMSVALARLGFITRQRHTLTRIHPCMNSRQSRPLLWQMAALVFGKQRIVIGLRFQIATLF